MENKLTPAIAAAYIGCQVKVITECSWQNDSHPFYSYEPNEIWELNWSTFSDICERASNFNLLLKPLYTITDQHAIEVANMWYNAEPWVITERSSMFMTLQSGNSYKLYIYFTNDDFIGCEELYSGKENIEAHGCEVETTDMGMAIIRVIDALRSMNYDLGYGNIPSLIDAGIALDINQEK